VRCDPATSTFGSTTATTVDFSMHDCTDNALFVAVDAAASVEAGVPDEC
jgi:hypothetical protein